MTDPTRFRNQDVVELVETRLAEGYLADLAPDDPYIDALMWMLLLVDVPLDERRVLQSFPHMPSEFTLEDLRNVLFRNGVATKLVRANKTNLTSANGPGLLVGRDGIPYIFEGEEPLACYDPTTGESGPNAIKDFLWLLQIQPKPEVPPKSWTREQIHMLTPYIRGVLIDKALLTVLSLVVALGIITIYQIVIPAQAFDTLVAMGICLGALMVFDLGLRRQQAKIVSQIAKRSEFILSTSVFRSVINLPYERLQAGPPAQQVARIRQLISSGSTSTGPLLDAVLDLPFAIIILGVVAVISPVLALVPFVMAVFIVMLSVLSLPAMRRLEHAQKEAQTKHNRCIQYLVNGAAQIAADGNEDVWLKQAHKEARATALATHRLEARRRTLDAIAGVSGPFAGGMVTILGAYLVMEGKIGTGALLGVIILSWRVLSPIHGLYHILAKLADLRDQFVSIDRLMGMPVENDAYDYPSHVLNARAIAVQRLLCKYPQSEEPALRGVSIDFPQGKITAVTGPSGSGKTTLLRAIVGMTPIRSGRVLISNINARQIPTTTLRTAVSYVPTRPRLLHGTIAQNLRLGNPVAGDDELYQTCSQVGLGEWIRNFPDGINTRLTAAQREMLPEGFVQSLALARTLLERPQTILLDEPASGMDEKLEASFLDTLEALRGTTTVIMVTHRPSHVRLCDYELKLNDGVIKSFSEIGDNRNA